MAELTVKFVIVFLLCSYTSVRFFVPLTGHEFLSRWLASAIWIAVSYAIAARLAAGGRVAIQGKAVLITCCDVGIGNDLARRLDRMGFKVFAGCVAANGEGVQNLREVCSPMLQVIELDVRSESKIAHAVASVEATLSSSGDALWGVVNIAATATFGMIDVVSVDFFQKVLDVNLWGTVRVTKAFLPLLRKSKGRIVNTSSVLGHFSPPYWAAYSMAKYAVQSFTDALRIEMQQWGVKAVIIEPGTFSTDNSMLHHGTLDELFETVWNSAPQDAKDAYGEEHFRSLKSALIPAINMTQQNNVSEEDAYTSALIDENPKDRYFPSNTLCKFIALAHYYLPVRIMDACYYFYLSLFLTKPQGLQSQ